MSETGPAKPKRFYKDAQLVSLEAGYAVHLDGKPVRTPMGKLLIIPVQALGEAVVGEWQAQGDAIDPASMPLCGYANTAIDRVGKDRQTVFDNLMYFAGSDLLCYRADQPDDLVKRQSENWQPVLDWVTRSLGASLLVTTGVLPVDQPEESLRALNDKISGLDDWQLTGVASLAAACGSVVLALAVVDAHIDAQQAFQLAQLDENFQSERWGLDEEAQARQQQLQKDVTSASLFLSLLEQ